MPRRKIEEYETIEKLIEELEKQAEYVEKEFKMYLIVDHRIYKALAAILRELRDIRRYLEELLRVS